MNKRAIGTKYEGLARDYLKKNGYEIVTSNYWNKIGEIDIIAREKDVLCFIEVKFRSPNSGYSGLEAVDKKKQKTIYSVAKFYMYTNNIKEDSKCRFDVVSIDEDKNKKLNITLIKNAFP